MSRPLLLALLCAVAPAAARAQTPTWQVETLQSTGPSDKRIDLTILGDGYRDVDQQQLGNDARNLISYLFSFTPFNEYRPLFNIQLIHVISNENGADNGTYGAVRDTALNASFNCNGIDRLLCVDLGTVRTVAARYTPAYDLLIVLVNDPKYGGSGGDVATVSLAPSSGDILRHELGHTLGKLADEYSSPYPGYPPCVSASQTDCTEPNATVKYTRDTVKWATWIDPGTAIPTLSTGSTPGIGLFEGCRYQATGVYRPKDSNCLMSALTDNAGTPNAYCSVCAEAMVRAFWKKASPVDGFAPASPAAVTPCGPVTFSVSPPFADSRWSYFWTVDGTPREEHSPQLTLARGDLPDGPHQLSVLVADTTPLVRNDPGGALRELQTWEVAAGACAPGPCDETASCSQGGCAKTFKPQGTACAPPACKNGMKSGAGTCDGSGTCGAQTVSCGAYACDDAGVDCRSSCSTDAQCAPGATCKKGACVAPAQTRKGPLGCSSTGGTGGAALGLALLAWLLARQKER